MKRILTKFSMISLFMIIGVLISLSQINIGNIFSSSAQANITVNSEMNYSGAKLEVNDTPLFQTDSTVASIINSTDEVADITDAELRIAYNLILNYFNINNFRLAYELLERAQYSQYANQDYTPYYRHVITYSNEFQDIINGTNTTNNIVWEIDQDTGMYSGIFPGGSTTKEKDARFAMQRFDFTRTIDGSGNLSIVMQDFYNFGAQSAEDYAEEPTVAAAVQLMYLAQERGIIYNYTTKIIYQSALPHYAPVSTSEALNEIRNYPHKNFELDSNISLYSLPYWTPIPAFFGNLDGNNYHISHMKIGIAFNAMKENYGLFEVLDGTVKNLFLSSLDIGSSELVSTNNIAMRSGALAGTMLSNAVAENVKTHGAIDFKSRSNTCIGSIAGYIPAQLYLVTTLQLFPVQAISAG